MLRLSTPHVTLRQVTRRVQCFDVVSSAGTASRAAPWASRSSPVAARRFYSMAPSAAMRRSATAASGVGSSSSFALDAAARTSSGVAFGVFGASGLAPATQRRLQATQEKTDSDAKAKTGEDGKAKTEGAEEGKTEAEGDEKAKGEEEPKKEESLFSAFSKLKDDIKQFPDIYNTPNMLNMMLFSIFVLCSTGSEGEGEWWTGFWGVDGNSFNPFSWIAHSVLTNNFLAMTFAMLLWHPLGHAMAAQIGSRGLLKFSALVAGVSGLSMWLFNSALTPTLGLANERQFGPWDVLAAMLVHQYFANGTTPWGLLLSYNGWVRYANLVGAVLIVWYDPQPLAIGAILGLAITKGKVFPNIATKV